MILRIRPPCVSAPKVRVVRPDSAAEVILALFFSMLFVTLGVAGFTAFCWKAASDLGNLTSFPFARGFFSQRGSWLLLAILACIFAKLIDAFAKLLKRPLQEADELATEVVRGFAATSE